MGKHGFAAKLHFKLKLLSDEVGSFQNFTVRIQRSIRKAKPKLLKHFPAILKMSTTRQRKTG
jgi:hypothetical protein